MKRGVKSEKKLQNSVINPWLVKIEDIGKSFEYQDNYLENIIALMPGHVYWKDRTGVILGCNDLQAYSAGFKSRKELIGKTDYDLPWKEQANELRRIDLEVLRTGLPHTVEEVSTLANGKTAIFLSKKIPWYQNGYKIGIFGISFDITEQKMYQAVLAQKENKISELSLISAAMAHELKTPLASIQLYIHSITRAVTNFFKENANYPELKIHPIQSACQTLLDETEEIKKEVFSIVKDAAGLINMLLLRFNSQKLQENLTICSLQESIKKALKSYTFNQKEENKIHLDIPMDFYFKGEPLYFTHVLHNLIKNALYYIEQENKGEIFIWSKEKTEGEFELHVKDTAKGISPEYIPFLFDAFFSKREGGNGVGLAFCKTIIESFGGTINCHSIEGEYAEFILTLPRWA